MTRTSRRVAVGLMVTLGLAGTGWTVSADQAQSSTAILRDQDEGQAPAERADGARRRQMPSEVLGWNQIFIDTLIATNTANSSSPRLGAIVHTAIFDAYNGIEHRYTPIFVRQNAPDGASRRASVIAAAYTTLAGLFPVTASGAGCELFGFTRRVERRLRPQRPIAQTTPLVRDADRAGRRLGH
jgi:hypothetical protein